MPGKFVTRAAERAGVSIETAEHRWKEAKSKVHKGKRRGSWYWGKVMNTFKRMMGLMENVTLQEWLLFESDSPFATWPEQFHLYDRYVAVKVVDDELYVSYDVEALMGENTKIQLSGGTSRYAANPDEVSYTLGYDRDFTQQLGIRSDNQFANFKEWAIDAVQKFIKREGLAEASAPRQRPFHEIVDHIHSDFYIGDGMHVEQESATPNKCTWNILRLMNDKPIGTLYLFRRGTKLWMSVHRMDQTMVKVENVEEFSEDDIKKFVRANPPAVLESKQSDNLKAKGWHEFTVEPISGQWPQSRGDLWRALDTAFGADDWQVMDVNDVHKHKWKNNLPVTYVHHPDTVPDLKALKAAGFRIRFLPD